jgi:hypothetical protein
MTITKINSWEATSFEFETDIHNQKIAADAAGKSDAIDY